MGGEDKARIPAAGIAAWASVVAGSLCMALELGISGTTPLSVAIPAMVGLHLFIGVGEALITMGALAFIAATRADLFKLRDARLVGQRRLSTA
jgi:cobalt/nickel transport system permease protein